MQMERNHTDDYYRAHLPSMAPSSGKAAGDSPKGTPSPGTSPWGRPVPTAGSAHTPALPKRHQSPPFPNNEFWFQSPSACRLGGAKQPQSSLYTETNLGCVLLLLFSVISSNETNEKWQYLYFTNKAYILPGNFCSPALPWKC